MTAYSWSIGTPTITIPTAPAAEQRRELLGKDIFFGNDFRIASNGDWLLVEGLEAMRQAIYRRLITRQGEYKIWPEYGVGLQEFVKKRRRPAEIAELGARIRANLLQDRRIQSVETVQVETIADGLKIVIAVRVKGETLTFRPFTFAEDKAA